MDAGSVFGAETTIQEATVKVSLPEIITFMFYFCVHHFETGVKPACLIYMQDTEQL